MHCAKCGTKIAEGQSFCPSCGTAVTGKAASGETSVSATKKKKGKGCLIAVILIVAIGAITAVMSSKDEKAAMSASSAVTTEEATKNGEDLVAWIRNRRSMTDMAREDAFARLKGKTVMLRGNVREIGKTALSDEVFVSLTVGQLDKMERINVQFNVRESMIEKIKTWNKGELHTMRGRIVSQGDLEDDAECDIAEIVE